MFDLTTAPATAAGDLAAVRALVADLDDGDWERPVRLPGWRVLDLVRHVVGAVTVHAAGIRDAARGVTVLPPSLSELPAAPVDQLAALDSATAELADAFGHLPPDCYGAVVPVPFGAVPMAVALQMVPLEYAMHRQDLADALGRPEALTPSVAAMVVEILPGMLPMLSAGTGVRDPGAATSGSLGFELVSSASTVRLSCVDGGPWELTSSLEGLPHSRIEGDDESLALFVMGRIPADHPGLTVTGDVDAASRFKQYFPGP